MSMKHWSKLPMAVDMAPYANWYQKVTKSCLNGISGTVVVEAGVRYGCSARIFTETLSASCRKWTLHLIDPVKTREALEVPQTYRLNCQYHSAKAEAVAHKFGDASIDLLHIDADVKGDHPYEMALQILLSFWYKLKPTGTIILHDCTDHFPTIQRLADELVKSGQWETEFAEPQAECPISAPCALRRKALEYDIYGISVVVPIIKDKWLSSLLADVAKNTVKPDEILVVDNSGVDVGRAICESFPDLPIRYLSQDKNIGVNGSWNLGLKEARYEHVCILNDDLILPPEFFAGIKRVFQTVPAVGLVVPKTVSVPKTVCSVPGEPGLWQLPQRQGWAFTVKKGIVSQIPEELYTFCGDDFLFHEVMLNGAWCVGDTNQQVYHYVGISQNVAERKALGLPVYESERKTWESIRAEVFQDVQ